MITKNDAIAAALLAAGYNSKQVSVKRRRGGYDAAITLTIRDAAVDYKKVEAVKSKFTKVDRCERTMEVLSGGNTYVDIELHENVVNAWAAHNLEEVKAAFVKMKELPENHGAGFVNDRFAMSYVNGNGSLIKVWDHHPNYGNWMKHDYRENEAVGLALAVFLRIQETPAELSVQLLHKTEDWELCKWKTVAYADENGAFIKAARITDVQTQDEKKVYIVDGGAYLAEELKLINRLS